jgi:hypothetical protein
VNAQLALFTAPTKAKAIRLGPNQRAVLTRALRHGNVRVREAGRIVYLRRGWTDPSRASSDFLDHAGLRVLISLRRLGLVRCRRDDDRWIPTQLGKRSHALVTEAT